MQASSVRIGAEVRGVHIHVCVHTLVHVYVRACAHVCVPMCVHVHACVSVHVCVLVCLCVCVYSGFVHPRGGSKAEEGRLGRCDNALKAADGFV